MTGLKTNTKRVAQIFGLLILTSVAMSSCKVGESCPAYGNKKRNNKSQYAVSIPLENPSQENS